MNARTAQFWLSLLVLGAACIVGGRAYAQSSQCYYWLKNTHGNVSAESIPGGPYFEAQAYCEAVFTRWKAQNGESWALEVCESPDGVNVPTGPGQTLTLGFRNLDPPNALNTSSTSSATTPVACPEPEACNQDWPEIGETFVTTHFPGTGITYCNPLSHCLMSVEPSISVEGTTIYKVTHTDQSCSTAFDPEPEELETETCVTSANGDQICLSRHGENCGYVNDQFTCLDRIESDGCDVFADGSRVCGSSAPTPPAPDSGTPGEKAPPDTVINIESRGDNVSYYNSTTVNNSARPPGTSGENPYRGPTGGSGGGEGEDPTKGYCPPGQTCDGSGEGSFAEVCTFQECTQAFFTRVKESPLVSSVLSAGAAIPTGSCPSWNVEIFGESFSLSAPMCSIWTEIAPLLSGAFLFIWAWVGTRIVLSA